MNPKKEKITLFTISVIFSWKEFYRYLNITMNIMILIYYLFLLFTFPNTLTTMESLISNNDIT